MWPIGLHKCLHKLTIFTIFEGFLTSYHDPWLWMLCNQVQSLSKVPRITNYFKIIVLAPSVTHRLAQNACTTWFYHFLHFLKISPAAFFKNGIQNGSIDVYFPFMKQSFENKPFLIHFVTKCLHKMLAQVVLPILRFFILKSYLEQWLGMVCHLDQSMSRVLTIANSLKIIDLAPSATHRLAQNACTSWFTHFEIFYFKKVTWSSD